MVTIYLLDVNAPKDIVHKPIHRLTSRKGGTTIQVLSVPNEYTLLMHNMHNMHERTTKELVHTH